MKASKFTYIIIFLFFISACGGSSSPTTPASLPISIESLDGATDVALDKSFQYEFESPVDPNTVTSDTFFIVQNSSQDISLPVNKAQVDSTICNPLNALPATIGYSSNTLFTLDPTNDLSGSTSYSICLTTGIRYLSGGSFEGFMATFTTTAASTSCTAPTCESIQDLIAQANSDGMRPGIAFSSVPLPEFTCTGGTPVYSVTGLPDSLSFDPTTRVLSLASGNSTIALGDAKMTISVTYTATVGSQATSLECLINDRDKDTMPDFFEYKYSSIPNGIVTLASQGFGGFSGFNLNDATDATYASEDFDSDGITNVAEAGAGTNPFFKASNATFSFSSSITAVTNTSFIVAANLEGHAEGDYDLDLVVVNQDNNAVSIFLNGNGTFGSATNYNFGANGRYAALGDFDGDSILDIAVTSPANDIVQILTGSGTGTFVQAASYNAGDGCRGVVTGDFNGDGKRDLATADRTAGTVTLLTGNGNSTFTTQSSFTVGQNPQIIISADFDNDGDLDIATANQGGSERVSVLIGNGAGSFDAVVNYSISEATGIVAADFNEDGNLDLAVGGGGSGGLSIFLGAGDGTFASAVNYSGGADAITAGDLNGDGHLDIGSTGDGTTISVFLGVGDGTFGTATTYSTDVHAFDITSGDFDGDGDLDLATANFSTGTVSVLTNQ